MGLNLKKALSGAVGGFLTGGPAGALAGGVTGALAGDGSVSPSTAQLNTQTNTTANENVVSNQDTTNQIDTTSTLAGSGTTAGATTGETAGAGTAVTGPSGLALPFIQELLAGAQGNLNAPATAGFNPNQVAGQNLLSGVTAGQIGDLGAQTAATQSFLSNPNILSPETNPFLAASIQGSIDPLLRNLTESILPSISGGATAVGGIGGSRQGIAEGQAIGDFLQTAGNISAQQASGAFQNGLGTLLASQGNANPLAALLQTPGNLLNQVGGQQQIQEQIALDERNRKLAEFAALLSSQNLGSQGATTQTGTTAGTTSGATTNQQTGTGASTQVGNVAGTVDTTKAKTSTTEALTSATPGQEQIGPLAGLGSGLAVGNFLNNLPTNAVTAPIPGAGIPAINSGSATDPGGVGFGGTVGQQSSSPLQFQQPFVVPPPPRVNNPTFNTSPSF